MSRADLEAVAFGALLFSLLVGGAVIVSVKEIQRNSACAERGGIVVGTVCGEFKPFPAPHTEKGE